VCYILLVTRKEVIGKSSLESSHVEKVARLEESDHIGSFQKLFVGNLDQHIHTHF
jgi:hypothetical protein